MVRWIAFDDETAEAVVSRFRRGAAEIHLSSSPIDSALTAGQPSLLLLPSDTPGRVLLARIHPKIELPAPRPAPVQLVAPRPPKSEKTSKNKKWWQRRIA
jgi:hypothetical protein